MIRDKIIQKRIRGKVLAVAMTAFMASLFVPMVGNTADVEETLTWPKDEITSANLNTGNLILEEGGWKITGGATGSCGEKCSGHVISGDLTTSKYGIEVLSGTHRIKLKGATINTDSNAGISALSLSESGKADVTLYLEGKNELSGPAGEAGIYVPYGTSLTIKSVDGNDGTLLAKGDGAAGIGGSGYVGTGASAGNITIDSGTITAIGGNRGSGIGASGDGIVQKITINGGVVIAKGGDGKDSTVDKNTKGAPGIGSVGDGEIEINKGQVTAIGGDNYGPDNIDNGHGKGISGTLLKTGANGGETVIKADEFSDNLRYNGFDGLVWNINRDKNTGKVVDSKGNVIVIEKNSTDIVIGDTCKVYGNAIMPPSFIKDFVGNKTLDIQENATFLIPVGNGTESEKLLNSGLITGKGTLVNPQMIKHVGGDLDDSNLTIRVSFKPSEDISIRKDLIYTGEILNRDVFTQNDKRKEGSTEYKVDYTGMTYKFEKKDSTPSTNTEINVVDAGEYNIVFTYGGVDYRMPFTVARRPITDADISVEPIPSIDYTGHVVGTRDFTQSDVVVKYKGEPLRTQDYDWAPKNDPQNAGTATMIISGKDTGNFTGSREELFKINQVSIKDADVTLKGISNYEVYNGKKHQALIDSVKLQRVDSSGNIIELEPAEKDDFVVEYSTSDFISAGEIKVQLTTANSKNKNYTDTCEVSYTIHPQQLEVRAITAVDRKYLDNGKVDIPKEGIEVDLSKDGENKGKIVDGDFGKIEPKGVQGYIGTSVDGKYPPANVGTYNTVTLEEDAVFGGTQGSNYTLAESYKTSNYKEPDLENPDFKQGPNALTKEVIIRQGDAPTVALSVESQENGDRFNCILRVDAIVGVIDPESTIYYYYAPAGEGGVVAPDKNEEGWNFAKYGEVTVSDERFLPQSKWVFWAYIEGNDNVPESNMVSADVLFDKLSRTDAPTTTFTLSEPELNAKGDTYTLRVIPGQTEPTLEYPNGMFVYSIVPEGMAEEEIKYSSKDFIEDAEPNRKYIAYVKWAESIYYKEGTERTATDVVETASVPANKPVVICNGGEPQDDGTIEFSGTASVVLDYPGDLKGMKIYYTLDGTTIPNAETGTEYEYGKTLDFAEDTTIKAIAIKDIAISPVMTVVLKKSLGDDPNNPNNPNNPSSGTEVELQKLTEETTPGLIAGTGLAGKWADEAAFGEISADLAAPILQQRGYENNNILYADLRIKIKGTDRYATDEDFKNAKDGVIRVTVTMDQLKAIALPQSYDAINHNFAVTHMFATGASVGTVESIGTPHNFSRSADGKSISFDMTSTSPVAFGWADVNSSDPMPVDPGTQDPGTQDPGTQDPGTQDPGTQDPGTQDSGTQNPNNLTADGEPRSGGQGDGTTTDTDAGTQGASNDAANALSGIMPKTGDPLSFVPWIAAAVVSVGAVVYFATRKTGKKKKQTLKKTQAAKKKK